MDKIIEENMGLVYSIVNSFKPKNETERNDLIDAGRIGLWKALLKYDKSKGALATFSWRPIRWEIIKELKKKRKNISIEKIQEPSVEVKEDLWDFVPNSLSSIEMEVIRLRQEGYKFKEICKVLNKKPHIVKNRFYKAMKKLREHNE